MNYPDHGLLTPEEVPSNSMLAILEMFLDLERVDRRVLEEIEDVDGYLFMSIFISFGGNFWERLLVEF